MPVKITLVFLPLLLFFPVWAQTSLPLDERGKISYVEIVEAPAVSESQLFQNAKEFAGQLSVRDSRKKFLVVDEDSLSVSSRGSYSVKNMLTIGKRIDGVVSFNVNIQVREGRYRYIINDFIFQEYAKNRYGKFMPVKGKTRPLESGITGPNKKQWEAYQNSTDERIQELILALKGNMMLLGKGQSQVNKAKTTNDW